MLEVPSEDEDDVMADFQRDNQQVDSIGEDGKSDPMNEGQDNRAAREVESHIDDGERGMGTLLKKTNTDIVDETNDEIRLRDTVSYDTWARTQSATEDQHSQDQSEERKKKRASVLGVLQVDQRNNNGGDENDSEEETQQSDTQPSKERTKKSAYGRLYSSIRRRKPLSRGTTDSENDESDRSIKDKAERKAEKKRAKEIKAEQKRRHKEEREQSKHTKKIVSDNNEESSTGGANADNRPKDKTEGPSSRRGTMPRNFKMHIMEVFRSTEEIESRSKKGKKGKKKKTNQGSELSYSEPEIDLVLRNRITAEDLSLDKDDELRKRLKKARKRNKQQEQQIRKQQLEIERMKKELLRVKRQRKERKRKERVGDEPGTSNGEAKGRA